MAHFAQLNENSEVIQVIVVSNAHLVENGVENESKGIAFCKKLNGEQTNWKQTSYNRNFRKNYAGIGYIYDETLDMFYPPKPYNSWLLNEDKGEWEAPIPYPSDDAYYEWNEEIEQWQLVNNEEQI